MRNLTNNHRDAQVLDLGSGSRHGPYLITQTGVAPSDPIPKTRLFVLRPDGQWVDFNAYACQGKAEVLDEIVFPNMTKVMERFTTLAGKPRVLNLPVDEAGLKAWISRHKEGDPLQAARVWATGYNARHRDDNNA